MLQIHNLVQFPERALIHPHLHRPPWLIEMLKQALWGTIRNVECKDGLLPVGIRGGLRHQRWSAFVSIKDITAWKRPQDLRSAQAAPERRELPVMRGLAMLEHRWQGLPYRWGPFGSTAFELATAERVITPESDLDLVVYISEPIDIDAARLFLGAVRGLPARADLRIETGHCGFSLEEYVREYGRPILLRCASGPQLGVDPWQVSR